MYKPRASSARAIKASETKLAWFMGVTRKYEQRRLHQRRNRINTSTLKLCVAGLCFVCDCFFFGRNVFLVGPKIRPK